MTKEIDERENLNSTKKIVLFETIKGVFVGTIGTVIGAAVLSSWQRGWASKTLKLPALEDISKILFGIPGFVVIGLFGLENFNKTVDHNNNVQNHSFLEKERERKNKYTPKSEER